MPCFPATLQAPVKGFCRPAVWIPGVRNLHSHSEYWHLDGDPSHCLEETLVAVESLNEIEHPNEFIVNKVRHDTHWVQIFCYSPTGWLDVLEVTYSPCGENDSYAKVLSSSTGVSPAWLPFGFFCDIMLCWFPFSDYGSNSMKCNSLREALPFNVVQIDPKESDRLLSPQATTSSAPYKDDRKLK